MLKQRKSFCCSTPGLLSPRESVLLLSLFISAVAFSTLHAQQMPLQLTQYSHTAWRSQEGTFSGSPLSITQTTDGYLWVGTTSGLLRYDGARFESWKDSSGKSTAPASIYSLLGARDGSLWFGTDTSLVHVEAGTEKTLPGASGRVNSILEDHQGKVWMIRSRSQDPNGPLCEVQGSMLHCHGRSEGMNDSSGMALAQDSAGTLWFGGPEELCAWNTGGARCYSPEGLSLTKNLQGIGALLPAPDGSILTGFYRPGAHLGLQEYKAGKLLPVIFPGVDGRTLTVASLLADREGGLWIGTTTQGLFHLNRGVGDHFGTTDGLSGDQVTSIYEDREGSIWVSTTGGLDQFHRLTVSSFSMKQGLGTDEMGGVLASRDNAIWAASPQGLQVLKDGHASSVQPKDGLPGELITALYQDRAGSLWMGVDDQLTRYSRGHFTIFKRPGGEAMGAIVSIAADQFQAIWVLVAGKPYRLFRVGTDQTVDEVPLPDPTSRRLVSDSTGQLWLVAVASRIYRYHDTAFAPVDKPTGSPRFRDLIVEGSGALWVTSAQGLYRWQNGRWDVLTSTNGLPCDASDSMLDDERGTLWVHLSCGFVALKQSDLSQWWSHPDTVLRPRLYGAFDGAAAGRSSFGPDATVSPGGQLWFANDAALQMIDPANLISNKLPPPVHVEQLVADRRIYSTSGNVKLPALTHDISIDYSALSFTVPQAVRFKYRLSGVDKDWQDVEGRRQAFYMNLRPGRHEFQVIACNNDGVWNTVGAKLSFTILPAFYQTIWFLTSAICIVLLAIWGIFQMRVRAAMTAVESRLGERLVERDRIARELHDTLLQGFQALLLHLQTAMRELPENEPARSSLLLALNRGDEILIEGRERVRDLRSHDSSAGALILMLHAAVAQMERLSGPTLELLVSGTPREVPLLVAEELSLFAREAISNAILHSQGDHVSCEVDFKDGGLFLLIQDDGVGISEEVRAARAASGHWGLLGMRERAGKLNAKMTIDTGPSGTRIALRVPRKVAYIRGGSSLRTKLKALFTDGTR